VTKTLLIATNSVELTQRSIKRRSYNPDQPGIRFVTNDDNDNIIGMSKKDTRIATNFYNGGENGPSDGYLGKLMDRFDVVGLEDGVRWLVS
jgi:hypothetical protein